MPVLSLPSFAKGEIGPSLYGRVDTNMYKVALRTARNAIIHSYGGVSNRPGTLCVSPFKFHTEALFPQIFPETASHKAGLYSRAARDRHYKPKEGSGAGSTGLYEYVFTHHGIHDAHYARDRDIPRSPLPGVHS